MMLACNSQLGAGVVVWLSKLLAHNGMRSSVYFSFMAKELHR
jgi:hypothetical protein